VLLDGDRTLCEPDTSRFFIERVNLDLAQIKQAFQEFGYTFPGFYNMVRCYSQIPLEDYVHHSRIIADDTILYPGVQEFLRDLQDRVDVLVVTSGIKEIWKRVLERFKLENVHLIAGSRIELDNFLIGKIEKGLISSYFRQKNKCTAAVGDSEIDQYMLANANLACVVINHRKNEDLIDHVRNHPNLFQISFRKYRFDNIPLIDFYKLSLIIKKMPNNSKTKLESECFNAFL